MISATRTSARSTASGSLRTVMAVALFVLLTALAAQVRIPVPGTDVPMTLQLVAVLLAGLMLTPGAALSAMIAYVGLGVAGLPVLSPGSAGLLGPTGGYLVGFAVAAWTVALICNRQPARGRCIAAAVVGVAIVLSFGMVWRIAWLAGDVGLAVQTSLWPFAPKAVVEAVLAGLIASRVNARRARSAVE